MKLKVFSSDLLEHSFSVFQFGDVLPVLNIARSISLFGWHVHAVHTLVLQALVVLSSLENLRIGQLLNTNSKIRLPQREF